MKVWNVTIVLYLLLLEPDSKSKSYSSRGYEPMLHIVN